MAVLTAHVVPQGGLRYDTLLVAADADGDSCPTGGGVLLIIANSSADTDHTVTLATPQTFSGLAIADQTVTVPQGGTVAIPVIDRLYRDSSTGLAAVTYDDATDLTVAVVRVAV